MSIEMWAGPLSFTCVVVMFAYVANEAAKFVHDSRQKRKTLDRLSRVSIHLVNANPALVSGERLPDDPGPSNADGDCSNTVPIWHRAACRTFCSTWPAWGTSKGYSERQTVARRTSRGSATISAVAWLRRGSKGLAHGRWGKAWARSRPQSSCGDECRASKRPNALTNSHSPNEYRVNGLVSNKFAKAFVCKPPMAQANALPHAVSRNRRAIGSVGR
jgi:hypothetical protein